MAAATTTTVYYTDYTSPSLILGSLTTGLKAKGTATQPRIEYSLYDDSATWNAWYSWAQQSAYDSTTMNTFSSRAMKIVGYYDTMAEGDLSAFCIQDASTTTPMGALCAEAVITVSGG